MVLLSFPNSDSGCLLPPRINWCSISQQILNVKRFFSSIIPKKPQRPTRIGATSNLIKFIYSSSKLRARQLGPFSPLAPSPFLTFLPPARTRGFPQYHVPHHGTDRKPSAHSRVFAAQIPTISHPRPILSPLYVRALSPFFLNPITIFVANEISLQSSNVLLTQLMKVDFFQLLHDLTKNFSFPIVDNVKLS